MGLGGKGGWAAVRQSSFFLGGGAGRCINSGFRGFGVDEISLVSMVLSHTPKIPRGVSYAIRHTRSSRRGIKIANLCFLKIKEIFFYYYVLFSASLCVVVTV